MKRHASTTALALATIMALAGPAPSGENTRTVQIFYHSDTRAYYRPCG